MTADRREGRPGRRRRWPALILAALLVAVAVAAPALVRVHAVASPAMEATLGVGDRVVSSRLALGVDGASHGDVVVLAHGETWEEASRTPASDPAEAWARGFGDLTGLGDSNHYFTLTRVIGLPGDEVACCDAEGRLTVNGEPRTEPAGVEDYDFAPGTLDCASWPRSGRCFAPVSVPADRLLVLGDHRAASADSLSGCRGTAPASGCARFVPAQRVAGRVMFRLWPPGPVG